MGHDVLGKSFIQFTPVDYVFPQKMDWLFFSSKRGVNYFILEPAHKKILMEAIGHGLKLAAIGPVTGDFIEKVYGIKCDFIGSSKDISLTAKEFLAIAKGQKVVFPQGFYSQQSIQKKAGAELDVQNLVVYQNIPIPQAIPAVEIAVFTSPLNVEAFVSNEIIHSLQDFKKVIAIGPTTAKALINAGRIPDRIPFAFDEVHLSMVCY